MQLAGSIHAPRPLRLRVNPTLDQSTFSCFIEQTMRVTTELHPTAPRTSERSMPPPRATSCLLAEVMQARKQA